jgi:hypothetical protein
MTGAIGASNSRSPRLGGPTGSARIACHSFAGATSKFIRHSARRDETKRFVERGQFYMRIDNDLSGLYQFFLAGHSQAVEPTDRIHHRWCRTHR